MNYQQADTSLQGRCRMQRKIGNNTYLIRIDDRIAIRLHSTYILTFHKDGSIEINTGGWNTVTTKARMNEHLPRPWGVGTDSRQYGSYLVLYRIGEAVALADGLIIPADGVFSKDVRDALDKVKDKAREERNARNRQRTKERYWIRKARTGGKPRKPLTIDMIQAEPNVTIRTAMISVYGLERFLTQVQAKVVDTYKDYQLLSYSLDNWQSVRALKMVCPSTKTVYIHAVPPRTETVSSALDWMFQTENYINRLQVEA